MYKDDCIKVNFCQHRMLTTGLMISPGSKRPPVNCVFDKHVTKRTIYLIGCCDLLNLAKLLGILVLNALQLRTLFGPF